MNRPDEIAALADEKADDTLELIQGLIKEGIDDCLTSADIIGNITVALGIPRLSATLPGDAVREALEATNQLLIDVQHDPSVEILERAARQFDKNIDALAALAPAEKAGDDIAQQIVSRWIEDCGGSVQFGFVESEMLQEHIRRALKSATPTPPSTDVDWSHDAAKVAAGAASIVDIMMGGNTSWRPKLDDSDFLESADWKMAMEYSFAALRAASGNISIQSAAPGGGTEGGSYIDDVERSFDETPLADSLKPSDPAQEPEAVALKPCPFCGSSDMFSERYDFSSSYMTCNNCCARGPAECQDNDDEENPGEEASKRAWNSRPVSLDREALIAHLNDARGNFAKISGDWTDPRDWCDEGCKAINSALALIEGMA